MNVALALGLGLAARWCRPYGTTAATTGTAPTTSRWSPAPVARDNRVIGRLAGCTELPVGAPIVVNHAVGGCSWRSQRGGPAWS
ncbi:MAG: hypothetical protein QOG10_5075, partial [Kribbellaceae bacterium]|nr:hypothetical protein [Kribbellaceae bacterium]